MAGTSDIRNSSSWFWGEGWLPFGLFAVPGGISIFVAHLIWPDAKWWVDGLAVTLMLLFGYWEWQYGEKRSLGQEDRLGDNFYYLGLIYTLTSVAHALYVFTNIDRVEPISIRF